jgi:hypothetical protein
MLFRTNKFAMEYMKGGASFLSLAWVFKVPYCLAQPEMLCKMLDFVAAISLSFSSNFSQTRGTARNIVGLAHYSVRTSEPERASGFAK